MQRLPLLALLVVSCGGKAVVDVGDQSGSASATSGAGASSSASADAAASSTSVSASATTGSGSDSCAGQPCGAFCQSCAPDCVSGHCDGHGACVPEVQGGPEQCPPPAAVVSDVACSTESLWCASDE